MAVEELSMELAEARTLSSRALTAEIEGDSELRTRELSLLIEEVSLARVFEMAQCLGLAEPSERAVAAHALRQVYELAPHDRVVQQLLAMIRDSNEPTVIAPIVTALGWTRQEVVVDAILDNRKHSSALVRHAVSDVVSMFSDERVLPALAELAHDVDVDVRWSAVFELAALNSDKRTDGISTLLREIASSDSSEEVRVVAAEALTGEP